MTEEKDAPAAVETNEEATEKIIPAPQDVQENPEDLATEEISAPEASNDDIDVDDKANEPTPDNSVERKAKLEERAINEASASADSMFVPSPTLLASNSPLPLIEEVDGPTLKNYAGSPNVYMARSVPLAAGMKFEVPIHVTSAGSVVEYTIESVKYDLKVGIVAEREEKETVVKALDVVDSHIKPCTGKFLVGTVPCALLFTFDNGYSWMTGKTVTYKIVVTPPSKENILRGRRRRATSALKAVEDDRASASKRLSNATKEKDTLIEAIDLLEKELAQQKTALDAILGEEAVLQSRVDLRTTQCDMLNDRLENGWEDQNDTN